MSLESFFPKNPLSDPSEWLGETTTEPSEKLMGTKTDDKLAEHGAAIAGLEAQMDKVESIDEKLDKLTARFWIILGMMIVQIVTTLGGPTALKVLKAFLE